MATVRNRSGRRHSPDFSKGRYRVLVATDVASRGIHVQDIAHVINYDLPEIAENFIHRVGRTGRAGKRGVASTLVLEEQRTELFQLERTLGIRMERMQVETDLRKRDPVRSGTEPIQSPPRRRMASLPGELLQAQTV